MKNLYVINTNYHLYLTLLKAHYDLENYGINSDIILTDHLINPLPNHMLKKLHEFELFETIYIMDDSKISKNIGRGIKKLFTYKNKILTEVGREFRKVKLDPFSSDYVDIFVFLDYSAISHYFMIKHHPINLIEDGMDIYYNYSENWRLHIDYLFGIPRKFALSSYIKKVWALNPEMLPDVLKHKAIKYDIQIYKSIQKNEFNKEMIRLFVADKSETMIRNILEANSKKVFLLLTQSYSEFGHMSEEKKIDIYKKTIEKYAKKDHFIIIKTHPKETTDYAKMFPNVTLLPGAIPVEIISDLFTSIDTCISINSTAQLNIKAKHNIIIEGEFNEIAWEKYMKQMHVKESK